jgi:nucleotide-binding universal stress UspA family protein
MKRIVLGSVAEHFVRIATCPVLLVRGSDEKDEAGQ